MNEKKSFLKQKNDQQPDFFQLFRQQTQKEVFMRFFYQQDKFVFCPLIMQNNKWVESQDELKIDLPLSRIISNTVIDTLLMNKFVYNNSKIVCSVLQNGRQMIQKSSKHLNWIDFLNKKQMIMVKNAISNLTPQQQWAIQFSVLSISNAILKLGINISKLTCIITAKKNTTNFLAIPTLSILYFQYLQYTLFQTKQIVEEMAKSQFLRQLPKITYIKFSQFFNKQQLMLMQIVQQRFFTQHSLLPLRNTQYLQFYEGQSNFNEDQYQRMTNCDFIRWINITKRYGLKSPLGFQLLFLFRTIYFKIIKDFNPDAIIIVEDYDNQKRSIQSSIRALLITQMMSQITGKVFVMRQVGFKRPQQSIFSKYGHEMKQKTTKQSQMSEQKNNQPSFPNNEQINEIIMQRIQNTALINQQMQRKLDQEQKRIMFRYFNERQQKLKNNPNYLYLTPISKIQQILRDDLSYIALALIQRSNFQQIYTKSHKYQYEIKFLKNIIVDIKQYWISKYVIPLNPSNEIKKQLRGKLEIVLNQINNMVQTYSIPIIQVFKSYYDSIYNIKLNKQIQLNAINLQTKKQSIIQYMDQDHVYIHYANEHTLVFIFKFQQFIILKLNKVTNINKQQSYYFQILADWSPFPTNITSRNCTYIIADSYIYKSFGLIEENNQLSGRSIYRANYIKFISNNNFQKSKRNLGQVSSSKKQPNHLFFQQVTRCMLQKDSMYVQGPLIEKSLGWAMFDNITKNTLFMGGLGQNCLSQNKINKLIHICFQNNKNIRVIGKTSNDIFLGVKNPKALIPLHPFIYGIPFLIGNLCYILNTNGFEQSFTNANKIYLTEFKMGTNKQDKKYGIISQRKLFVNYEKQDERIYIVTAKQHLIHYMVNSYNLKNIYQNKCILQTIQQGVLMLELNIIDQINKKNTISLTMTAADQIKNGFSSIKLYFNPLST